MSLKDEYLFLALCTIGCLFLNGILQWISIFLCVAIFYKRNPNQWFLFTICLLIMTQFPHIQQEQKSSNLVEVIAIKENYIIVEHKDFKALLYNVDDVVMNDIIEVEGDYETIVSNQNFSLFNFASYMSQRNITQSMYVQSFTVVKHSTSIKGKVYSFLKQHSLHELYLAYFYGIQNEDNLLNSSGFHFVLLIGWIALLVKQKQAQITLIFCSVYIILFPVEVFIVRMFVFSLVYLCLPHHKYDKLGISILILLLYQPHYIYEIGFILPVLFRLAFIFNIHKVNKIILSFLIVVGIQLFYFNEANLVVVLLFPLFRILNGLVFVCIVISLIIPVLQAPILFLYNSITYIEQMNLPYTIIWGHMHILTVFAYTYFIVQYLSSKQNKYAMGIFLVLLYQAHLKVLTPYGEVSVLDVGQGDCILIREPFNGEVMLIDTGGNKNYDIAAKIVLPVLKSKGITHIDKVLITHDDYDHSGALTSLQSLISIEEVISTAQTITLQQLKFDAYQYEQASDTNEQSIMLYAKINKLDYLFCGDASAKVEEDFIKQYNNLTIDVLKLGHHGSQTSSSEIFIQALRPRYAFNSSGKNNTYNHPHISVVNRLEEYNVKWYDTQSHGNLSVIYTPFFNLFHTGNQTFGIMGWVIL